MASIFDERRGAARTRHGVLTAATAAYVGFARNNLWANHRLLTACTQLPRGEFTAQRTGFFPSLVETLNHILVVDRFYIDGLEGGTLGPAAWADPVPHRTAATLREEQASLDRRLLALCEALDEAGLARTVRLRREHFFQVERTDRILLHLFQHQIHHRGQAHAMLSATSVPPPQLDEFFPAADAPLRSEDLAEIGLAEPTLP